MDQGLLSMKLSPLAIVLIFLTAQNSFAAHAHPAKYYQEKWRSEHNGQAEVVLPDQTRADCVTSTHAIECVFRTKTASVPAGKRPPFRWENGRRSDWNTAGVPVKTASTN